MNYALKGSAVAVGLLTVAVMTDGVFGLLDSVNLLGLRYCPFCVQDCKCTQRPSAESRHLSWVFELLRCTDKYN